MGFFNKNLKKVFELAGYSIDPIKSIYHDIDVELTNEKIEIVKFVMDKGFTLTSVRRLVNTIKSCKYVVSNNIAGDFIECGVYRGGNSIIAKKIFEMMGSKKRVWLFDTFNGMTQPGDDDINARSKVRASIKYQKTLDNDRSNWCYASIDDVKQNCKDSSIDLNGLNFIQGDVCETLKIPKNIPDAISVLRLDTDWYQSTKVELEVLYPKLTKKGVLVIDDYGHWAGSKKAVEEYFATKEFKPLLNAIDFSGRCAIKA